MMMMMMMPKQYVMGFSAVLFWRLETIRALPQPDASQHHLYTASPPSVCCSQTATTWKSSKSPTVPNHTPANIMTTQSIAISVRRLSGQPMYAGNEASSGTCLTSTFQQSSASPSASLHFLLRPLTRRRLP